MLRRWFAGRPGRQVDRWMAAWAAARVVLCFAVLGWSGAWAAGGAPSGAPAPQRVVSLLPSLTEVVCDLGACERLVGVDDFSNWPDSVQRLPRLGGLVDTRLEALLSLRPQLVLAAPSTRAVARMRELGVPLLVLSPQRLSELPEVYERVAHALGGVGGAQAWARIDAAMSAAAQRLPATQRGARVYVEVDAGLFAAGDASFIGDVMRRAGLRNAVGAELGAYPQLSPEFVLRADPDWVVMPAQLWAQARSRPGWAQLRAVRNGQVCVLTRAQGDTLVRPGPRLVQAVELWADCVSGRLRPAGMGVGSGAGGG